MHVTLFVLQKNAIFMQSTQRSKALLADISTSNRRSGDVDRKGEPSSTLQEDCIWYIHTGLKEFYKNQSISTQVQILNRTSESFVSILYPSRLGEEISNFRL